MEFEITLNTKNGTIDILYSGYNIISTTIYSEKTTQKIIELLQNELDEDLQKIIDINNR
jgi:hypothetical protein